MKCWRFIRDVNGLMMRTTTCFETLPDFYIMKTFDLKLALQFIHDIEFK